MMMGFSDDENGTSSCDDSVAGEDTSASVKGFAWAAGICRCMAGSIYIRTSFIGESS